MAKLPKTVHEFFSKAGKKGIKTIHKKGRKYLSENGKKGAAVRWGNKKSD